MKKKIIFILGGLIVIGVGYWLISPLFITKRVDEKLEDILPPAASPVAEEAPTGVVSSNIPSPPPQTTTPAVNVERRGSFVGLAGHSGAGTAKLIRAGNQWHVRFEDDFTVTNGPDLFVYFGKDGQYAAATKLAALKGNVGGQNYEVPANINPDDYNEVWVWCRAFSVPFAKAEFK